MNQKTIVVAELGINHNGSYETLIELADMAMEAGADFVKLQIRTPTVCVPAKEWDKPRLWFDGQIISYIEYKERMEFGVDDLRAFDGYMRAVWGQNRWFASVWDHSSLNRIEEFELPYIKIPSALLTNFLLITEVSGRGNHIIMSTGMSTRDEIDGAIKCISVRDETTLLHCHSAYPSPVDELNLNTMHTIRSRYLVDVGFSSHATSPFPSIYAAVLGASMVEVHVTLDRAMQGTDHGASLEQPGLTLLCREIKKLSRMLGDGEIRVYDSERAARQKLRGAD